MNPLINNFLTALNSLGSAFCDYAGNMFVQSGVLIVLLLIIDSLIRKRVRATFRYWIWMLVFVKLILPPSLSLPTGIGYWRGEILSAAQPVLEQGSTAPQNKPVGPHVLEDTPLPIEAPQIQPSQITSGPISPTTLVASHLNALTWQAGVFVLWLVGVLVFSLLLIQRILYVSRLIVQSRPVENRFTQMLNQCREQVGIRRPIELRLSNNVSSPAVCGFFRPVILMPAGLLERLSTDKLRAVLIHELAHIKRGDLWINCVQTFLQIAYFYNPFVWLANTVVRRIREQAVDEMVLVALGAGAKDYSNTLIDIAEMAFFKTSLSLRLIGVVESKKALRRRIRHMLNRPIPESTKLGILGLMVIFVIAAVLLPMANSANNSPAANDSDTEIMLVRWMAVLEPALTQNILSISKPVKTENSPYHCFTCDGDNLTETIKQGLEKNNVIHLAKELKWIEQSPKHVRSDGWADTANLKHPLYVGYGSGGGGQYKFRISKEEANIELQYASVNCFLNSGPRIAGNISFKGDINSGNAIVFLGSLKENEQDKASYLVVWQAVKVPSNIVPHMNSILIAQDWIQMGQSGILKLAEEGLRRNENLLAPAKSSERWTHTFPDGREVRLVAVFRPKDNPFRFWDPDGHAISGLPQWHDRDVAGDELAVVYERPKYTEGKIAAPEVKYYSNYGWGSLKQNDTPVASFARGYGNWQDVATLRQGQKIEHEGFDYTIEKVEEMFSGPNLQVHVAMWYNLNRNIGIRLIAVDKSGKEHPMQPEDTFIGNFEKGQRMRYYQTIMGLATSDVSHFKLQSRHLAWAQFSGFATKPKEQLSAETNRSFSATLPDGVTVQLVGLCTGPDTNGCQWWRPDGTNMPEPSYLASKRVPPFASIPTQYIFLAKATGSEDLSLHIRIYEGTGLSTRAASDGTALCYVRYHDPEQAYHKDGFIKGPVEIGVARGQWLRARGVNSNIQNPRSYLIGSGDEIVIQPPQPEKSSPEMATSFWATANSHDYEYRLKCTLKNGKVQEVMRPNFQHTETIETKGISRSTLAQISFNIDQPLNQIVDYELLYRKFEYVRFNNVAFKPELETDVQIEIEGPDVLRVPSDRYPTIQSAVEAAKDGDKIVLDPSVTKDDVPEQNKPLVNTRKSNRYETTLPNGVKVELVGLFTGPSNEILTWWRPDGTGMSQQEYALYEDKIRPQNIRHHETLEFEYGYVLLFSPSDVSVMVDVTVGMRGTCEPPGNDGFSINYVESDKNQREKGLPRIGAINVAAAYGPFTAKGWNRGSMGGSNRVGFEPQSFSLDDGSTIMLTPVRPDRHEPESGLMVDAIVNANDVDINVLYESKDGKKQKVEMDGFGGSFLVSPFQKLKPMIQYTFRLRSIKQEDLKRIAVEYRRFKGISFKDVALKPNVKTNVQIEAIGAFIANGLSVDNLKGDRSMSGATRLPRPEKQTSQ